MSTYLDLCQEVALQSGTVPTLGDPSTVTGATGRLLRIVGWTSKAWEDIQRASDDWRWMSADFSGETIAGTAEYDAAAMGITTRFRSWRSRGEKAETMYSIYRTSDGPADEGLLYFRDWDYMRRNVFIGDWLSNTARRGKPAFITVAPNDKLMLYPVPDAVYTIRGVYRKSPQVLTADGDVPECPEHFHEVITWKALIRCAIFDEAFSNLPTYERMYLNALYDLQQDQLPKVQLGRALA